MQLHVAGKHHSLKANQITWQERETETNDSQRVSSWRRQPRLWRTLHESCAFTKVLSNVFNATVQGQKEFEELREDDGMVDVWCPNLIRYVSKQLPLTDRSCRLGDQKLQNNTVSICVKVKSTTLPRKWRQVGEKQSKWQILLESTAKAAKYPEWLTNIAITEGPTKKMQIVRGLVSFIINSSKNWGPFNLDGDLIQSDCVETEHPQVEQTEGHHGSPRQDQTRTFVYMFPSHFSW